MYRRTADNFESVINSLKNGAGTFVCAVPVFRGTRSTTMNEDNNSGLRAMFRDVRIIVASGTVTVTNKQTGGVIFSGSLNSIDSGTFHPENMPAGPSSNVNGLHLHVQSVGCVPV